MTTISANLQAVLARIGEAARRCGRQPEEISLLAVAKAWPGSYVQEAARAGQKAFGENYVQEGVDKVRETALPDLEWHFIGPLQSNKTRLVAECAHWVHSIDRLKIAERLAARLGRAPLFCPGNANDVIRRIGWCSGGGQSYINLAAEQGLDAFFTGEASEQTVHVAREMGIHFFAAGHHATERYGIRALGDWLVTTQGLDVTFVDIDNPV